MADCASLLAQRGESLAYVYTRIIQCLDPRIGRTIKSIFKIVCAAMDVVATIASVITLSPKSCMEERVKMQLRLKKICSPTNTFEVRSPKVQSGSCTSLTAPSADTQILNVICSVQRQHYYLFVSLACLPTSGLDFENQPRQLLDTDAIALALRQTLTQVEWQSINLKTGLRYYCNRGICQQKVISSYAIRVRVSNICICTTGVSGRTT